MAKCVRNILSVYEDEVQVQDLLETECSDFGPGRSFGMVIVPLSDCKGKRLQHSVKDLESLLFFEGEKGGHDDLNT